MVREVFITAIYIAGHFGSQERLRQVRTGFENIGYRVTSRWLDYAGSAETSFEHDVDRALIDLDDIEEANILILDTFDPPTRGGKSVEFGYAMKCLGLHRTYIVGPHRNIFHSLARKRFEDWDEARRYFRELRRQ